MKNKNNINTFEEDVILNSLGLLDKNEEEALLSETANVNTDDNRKDILKEFNNLTSLIAQMLIFTKNHVAPSRSVKEKLFEKINTGKNIITGKNKTGFEFIHTESVEWMPYPDVPGIQVKRLAVNEKKEYLMILLKAEAGAKYPEHHHSGAEECYVLEGDLKVEGKILGPGDFHHAEGDSDHDPITTQNGCTLLLVVDPRDY